MTATTEYYSVDCWEAVKKRRAGGRSTKRSQMRFKKGERSQLKFNVCLAYSRVAADNDKRQNVRFGGVCGGWILGTWDATVCIRLKWSNGDEKLSNRKARNEIGAWCTSLGSLGSVANRSTESIVYKSRNEKKTFAHMPKNLSSKGYP